MVVPRTVFMAATESKRAYKIIIKIGRKLVVEFLCVPPP